MTDLPFDDPKRAFELMGIHAYISKKTNDGDHQGVKDAIDSLDIEQLRDLLFILFAAAGLAHRSGTIVFDEEGFKQAAEAEVDRLLDGP